jgi:hypothetical protein
VIIDTKLSVRLRRFIEEDCIFRLCLAERGGALNFKHLYMAMKAILFEFKIRA